MRLNSGCSHSTCYVTLASIIPMKSVAFLDIREIDGIDAAKTRDELFFPRK